VQFISDDSVANLTAIPHHLYITYIANGNHKFTSKIWLGE